MIQENEISERFAKQLRLAGWSPGRRVATDEWINVLAGEGYTVNDLSVSILESVGKLEVDLPKSEVCPYDHQLRFEPVIAASGEFDRIEDWQAELKLTLFPIGEVVRASNIVWVGSDGRFYYGREFGLYWLGDNIRDAMDRLAYPSRPLELDQCGD